MDLFNLLASTPPRGEKCKIGEHGESPQLTPVKLEGAHLTVDNDDFDHFPNEQDNFAMNATDEQDDVFEQEHGPVLKKRRVRRHQQVAQVTIEQRLKKWGMDKEFTVLGGSRLGCITCMKYGAWCEQEVADTQKKKKKKKEPKKVKKKENKEKPLLMPEVHTEEVKSPRKSHGPAEADSCDEEETTHADIQHAFQKGTYKPHALKRFKYSLERHLSGSQHKNAAGAREDKQNEHLKYQDVPSDAQMMFVYDALKKSPMVPPLPPLPREYYGYYGLIARICVSDTQSHHDLNSPGDRYMLQNMKQTGITQRKLVHMLYGSHVININCFDHIPHHPGYCWQGIRWPRETSIGTDVRKPEAVAT